MSHLTGGSCCLDDCGKRPACGVRDMLSDVGAPIRCSQVCSLPRTRLLLVSRTTLPPASPPISEKTLLNPVLVHHSFPKLESQSGHQNSHRHHRHVICLRRQLRPAPFLLPNCLKGRQRDAASRGSLRTRLQQLGLSQPRARSRVSVPVAHAGSRDPRRSSLPCCLPGGT